MSTIKLTPLLNEIVFRSIIESVGGDADKIEKETEDLEQELEKSGMDADSEEVQAAMLNALVDADGDVEQLDVSDVESIAKDIKESRGSVINEGGKVVMVLEAIFGVLGNAALLNAIAEKVEKTTGKKIDPAKLKTKIDKVADRVKNITGLPAVAMERVFAWMAKKLGGGIFAQKIAGYSGTFIAVLLMFLFGIMHFPGVASIPFFIFSIAGLLGKGTEMIKMVKEIVHEVKIEMEKNKGTKPALST